MTRKTACHASLTQKNDQHRFESLSYTGFVCQRLTYQSVLLDAQSFVSFNKSMALDVLIIPCGELTGTQWLLLYNGKLYSQNVVYSFDLH